MFAEEERDTDCGVCSTVPRPRNRTREENGRGLKPTGDLLDFFRFKISINLNGTIDTTQPRQ